MKVTDTANDSFERVFCDIVGPLPTTYNDNKYILTTQDDLTKFIEATPLPDKSAKTVARALVEKFFLKYITPKTLVTDKGTEFMNKVMTEICDFLKIDQKTSAPYHHETIGGLENSHKSLGNYLRNFANEDQFTWDTYLPYFTFSFNSTVHESTGFTPFELIFGKNNVITGPKSSENYVSLENYDKELKMRLKIALQQAKNYQITRKEKRKENYDEKFSVKPDEIQTGDFVLIKKETGNKLEPLYEGPYEVIRTDESNLFIEKKNLILKIHKNNAKPFFSLMTFWIKEHYD